jgi:hypothetical protein
MARALGVGGRHGIGRFDDGSGGCRMTNEFHDRMMAILMWSAIAVPTIAVLVWAAAQVLLRF